MLRALGMYVKTVPTCEADTIIIIITVLFPFNR